jgi:DNA repair protein RecO (recombination protein O)
MMLQKGSSTGLVLSVMDYQDADCLVEILSFDFGKRLFMAKGIRRPKSKKRSALQIFNKVDYSWSQTKGLPLVLEAQVKETFPGIRQSLNKMALAFYFCEIIKKTIHEEDPHSDLYELLSKYLTQVAVSKKLKSLRQAFLHDILATLGYLTENTQTNNLDAEIEKITEKRINSFRVGKALL